MRLVVFLVVFSFGTVVQAQESVFKAGILAGGSASQVSGDALSGFDKFGLSAGAFVRPVFSESSSLHVGINYVNKGSRRNADLDNGTLAYAIKLNYVEIPILYEYTYSPFNLRGEAGVSIGRLISSSELGTDGFERDFLFPFEQMEYAVVFGASYLLSENFFFNARLSQSVIPVRKSPSVVNRGNFYEAGMYNSVIQVILGYEF